MPRFRKECVSVAPRSNYRLPPHVIEADRTALRALTSLSDYSPRNPAYETANLLALESELAQAEEVERLTRLAFEQARDEVLVAARALHDAVMGAKVQVVAQYGDDSYAVMAIGRKKRSEHKRPTRRVTTV